jgi:hypothetical protein
MKIRANAFKSPTKIGLEDRPVPRAGFSKAVVRLLLCKTN